MNILFVAALILALVPVGSGFAEGTPVVTEGYVDPADLKAGVRFRNFSSGSGNEVYLGDPADLTGKGSASFDFTWKKLPASNSFELSYEPTTDPATGNLHLIVNGVSYAPLPVGDLETLNYIKLTVTRKINNPNNPPPDMNLTSFKVNGSETNPSLFTADGTQQWSVTGIDLSAGFNITGIINLESKGPSGEAFNVEIDVGYIAIPIINSIWVNDITDNFAYWHANAKLNASVATSLNLVDPPPSPEDVQITFAEYNLNEATDLKGEIDWVDMNAADGAFDAATEVANAVFPANQLGINTACVQAGDSLLNVSNVVCQDFMVFYKFYGFLDPLALDNNIVNEVNAGRAVPIKWRLTDGLDVPISDPNSIAGYYSFPVPCTDFSGEITDAISEEEVPGTSGLQYLGDGNWQFNWKTQKSYSDSCRIFFLQFDNGQESVPAQFKFK